MTRQGPEDRQIPLHTEHEHDSDSNEPANKESLSVQGEIDRINSKLDSNEKLLREILAVIG